MILALMCVLACALFSGMMIGAVLKKPERFLQEYAPAVQQRFLEKNSQFTPESPKKQTLTLVLAKAAAAVLFLAVLAGMVYLAGSRGFWSGFAFSYLIWLVVNWFDVFALDMGVFAHWKKIRLPGTEDMDAEYQSNYKKHLNDGVFGTCIGLPICALCGAIIHILMKL